MRIYLVQHGEALTKDVDPDRPLSAAGSDDVKRLADFLGQKEIRVSRVLHSGKRRAEQTAESLAKAMAPDAAPTAIEGLNPLDPPGPLAAQIQIWTDDALLAGHQPFMGKLVSFLLCGDEECMGAAFLPGTAVCLEREDEGGWNLVWMLRPELLQK